MPLIEHHSRIAIADESDIADPEPTHGMVDLAAALAGDAWYATPLGKAVETLVVALQNALPDKLADPFADLEFWREETIRYGARLGFALARTAATADRGWAAWMAEAESWLRAAECGVAAHQSTLHDYKEGFLADIQKVEQSTTSTGASSPDKSPGAPPEHARRHHATPAPTPPEPGK